MRYCYAENVFDEIFEDLWRRNICWVKRKKGLKLSLQQFYFRITEAVEKLHSNDIFDNIVSISHENNVDITQRKNQMKLLNIYR